MNCSMTFTMHTAAERPDLWERGIPSESVRVARVQHAWRRARPWWGHLDEDLPEFQFVLYDEANDEVVAEGHTGPLWWEGRDETLPNGIDAAIEQIFSRPGVGEPVNTLCALAAETPGMVACTDLPSICCGVCARLANVKGSPTWWLLSGRR
jgi:hypothetical protein